MPVATDRRLFLKFLGAGVTGAVSSSMSPLGPIVEAAGPMPFQAPVQPPAAASTFLTFDPLKPSSEDALILPRGFDQQVLIKYGDRFTSSGERFGFNADFTAFFPRNADGSEGLLAVNHEYVGTDTDYYGQAFAEVVGGVPQLADRKLDVGVSVVHIRKQPNASWSVMPSALNKRITADTLMIAIGAGVAGRLERRRHVGQLLRRTHALEHAAHLRRELPGLRARRSRHQWHRHGRWALPEERHAFRVGGRDRSARSQLGAGQAHVARTLPS